MSVNRENATRAVTDFLAAIGLDPDDPEFRRAPERVVDLASGIIAAADTDPVTALGKPLQATEEELRGQIVHVKDIELRSACPHHLLPFEGVAEIAFTPRARLVGFSRLVRVVAAVAAHPQLQERMGAQIADAIVEVIDPIGVTVRLEASHGCVAALEPHGAQAKMVTVCRRGDAPALDS